MAAQTGVAVESFQRLQRAVRDAGGQDQHLVNALTRIKDAQGEVITGDKIMLEALERLNISAEAFVASDVDGATLLLAQALTKSGNAANEFSAVADIIGQRNAPKLIEAFNAMATGADKLGDNLKILSNRNAQILDLMADKWEQFKSNVKTGAATFVGRLFMRGFEGEVAERIADQERIAGLEREARVRGLAEQKRIASEAAEAEKEKAVEVHAVRRQHIDDEARIRKELFGTARVDSFRQVGGLIGNQTSALLRESRLQLELDRARNDRLTEIAANTADNGGLA